MKYDDITGKIIRCAMTVHSTLGNGFQEVIYQRALAIEMKLNNLQFEREKELPVYYRNQEIGSRRADFFVENCIMVELKALLKLEEAHLAQAKNYLEAFQMEVGLLINFGAKSLEFKRVHNNKILNQNISKTEQHSHANPLIR
ncbi:MAG: GxxExxY protein [Desulfobacterales bacterium]